MSNSAAYEDSGVPLIHRSLPLRAASDGCDGKAADGEAGWTPAEHRQRSQGGHRESRSRHGSVDSGIRVRVPAKINLALMVGRQRSDQYHELATLFQAVSLYDDITASSSSDGITCEVLGAEAHKIGVGDDNLAVRAAKLLQEIYGITEGVHLVIDKRIPVAGGMAGGSADAAGALLACARFWELRIPVNELMELGAQLGADVPFPLMGGCAVGLGRGESLTPALCRGVFHWVLAFSTSHLSTPEVFRRFDEITAPHSIPAIPQVSQELMMALISGDLDRVGELLLNDLSQASCSLLPELHTTLRAGREAGCLGAIISGSGPTIAFLTKSESAAADLGVTLSSLGIARDIRLVTGPVGGAHFLED